MRDRSDRRIILKSRQTGISACSGIEALWRAQNKPDSVHLFISRNKDAAELLVNYCKVTLQAWPRDLVQPKTENRSELVFPNNAAIISLPASPTTGRGYPASSVYLDEFAFQQWADQIYEGVLPTVSTGGDMTVLSTPNGRSNMFYRIWSGAEGGEWAKHFVHWSECPEYDEVWAQKMRSNMSEQSWAQEYDCDFLRSGDTPFRVEDLVRAMAHFRESSVASGRVLTAWDIGRRRDWTVGITLRELTKLVVVECLLCEHHDPACLACPKPWGHFATLPQASWQAVDYVRLREPYPVIQDAIDQHTKRWPGEVYIDSTGVGDPVIENLTSTQVLPYVLTPKSKHAALTALQILLEQGRFLHNIPQLDRELGLYAWDDEHLVTDSVMAAAIGAVAALEAGATPYVVPFGATKESHWNSFNDRES